MKQNIKIAISLVIIILMFVPAVIAGNKQRVAQNGAGELLINPWAGSSGLGSANIACVTGLEGVFGNVAGTAHLNNTQIIFANTNWLSGADINVNAFGLSQKVGDAGVLSLTAMQMDWGEIQRTTVELPDGDGSTFHPRYTNIGISYAKEFSNSIYGGVTMKVISENIADMGASGVAFDAGIQYITGEREQIKFGVTMKNVGPTMKMEGDGMSFSGNYPGGPVMTAEMRSAEFELPSLISLGFSYDFDLGADHEIVAMGSFTENSFSKNQYSGGLQYSFKNMLQLRCGYNYEEGITDDIERSTVFTGLSAGFSFEVPFTKGSDQTFAVDYSYRDTDPFNGVHSIGVRISL